MHWTSKFVSGDQYFMTVVREGDCMAHTTMRPRDYPHIMSPLPQLTDNRVIRPVESLSAVDTETDELLRCHRITGQGQRHAEGSTVKREEQLSAVGMIVCVPQDHALRQVGVVYARELCRLGIRQNVMAVDGFVAAVKDVASPFADEHAFGGSALVAGIRIDRSAALRGPADDFNGAVLGVVYQLTVALKCHARGVHDRHYDAREAGG
jgi:hypothetical protein